MPLPADDVVAITQLYARYNHMLDSGKAQEWAELYVADGSLDVGYDKPSGHEALVAFADAYTAMMPTGRHMATDVMVDGDGPDATGAAYLELRVADEDPNKYNVAATGVYNDTLTKTEAGWRFVTRTFNSDQNY